MATQATDSAGFVVPRVFRWVVCKNLTLSGSSQQVTLSGRGGVVRIATDAQGAILAVGTNPTAASSAADTASYRIPASTVDYVFVLPTDKIAFLQLGTAGTISITEGL